MRQEIGMSRSFSMTKQRKRQGNLSKFVLLASVLVLVITVSKYINIIRGHQRIGSIGRMSTRNENTSSAVKIPAAATSVGRTKARNEKAFVLAVELTFSKEEDAKNVISAWSKLADWCYENEPFLYHFEVGQSDKDPLKYLVYERYQSKDDYLTAHKSSTAFLEFRPLLKELQDNGLVSIAGNSYNELGTGFV